MSSLRELRIIGTLLTDKSLRTLTPLPKIQQLAIDPAEMNNDGLSHLPQMAQLRSLTIGGNSKHITDEGLKHLHRMADLERFYYTNELGTTEQGITDLKAALLDCRIANLDE